MEKLFVTSGVYYVSVPEVGLRILCGCPPDVVKHLMKRGLISQKSSSHGFIETGPNAILLSDVSVQGGKLSNLAEFPILQMFYRQGMIIPDHPGNTGAKPLVIGHTDQVRALSEYLFRGTYGLANQQEVEDTGVDPDFAAEVIRIKLAFAYNKIRKSDELLELVPLQSKKIEARPGFWISRLSENVFRLETEDQTLEVNLNLENGHSYEPPVKLDYHRISREYFSIVHIGEGDGWDTQRPCMSSIITFQGKIYLIDTGPNIIDSLTSLGISVNEVDGIFHTHAHDDHFAGLTTMIRTDHKVKHYATPLVRAGLIKKLCAITGLPESNFENSFEIYDLKQDSWNDIDGLEVMPVFSLHPVETTVLFFRTLWDGGYKTYGHLADIASEKVLYSMLMEAKNRTKLSEDLYRSLNRALLTPMDIKKIDIGGGMIHGEAKDFVHDRSKKIVLAHVSRDLTTQEKEIGSNASFGQEDILIAAQQDYVRRAAAGYLSRYFPHAKSHELQMLLNCPSRVVNPGFIIQKKGHIPSTVYLIITGVAELVRAESHLDYMLSAGTIIGELDALGGDSTEFTYRARSYLNVLEIPMELYRQFIQRNSDLGRVRQIASDMLLLQSTRLFGELVSSPVLHGIARAMNRIELDEGQEVPAFHEPQLMMLEKGSVALKREGRMIETLLPGAFFGESSLVQKGCQDGYSGLCQEPCRLITMPGQAIRGIPILEWKLMDLCEKRLKQSLSD